MDKYDKLMQDLIEFLKETDLGRRAGRDPIRGSTDAEIEAVEQEIGKQLPAALRAWYRVAGSVPPSGESETEPSLNNLQYAQTIAADVTKYDPCELKLESHILPFSQRYQDQFLFVNTKEGHPDNPPVYHFDGCGGGQPSQVSPSFTTFMRDIWTSPLKSSAVYDEIRHKIYARFDQETD